MTDLDVLNGDIGAAGDDLARTLAYIQIAGYVLLFHGNSAFLPCLTRAARLRYR